MALKTAPIEDFFAALRFQQDATKRAIMQARFDIAQRVVAATQDNILKTFGASGSGGGTPRSMLTYLAYGGSGRSSGRSGDLFKSVQVETTAKEAETVVVSVGGKAAPYAEVHERGGTITPTSAQYLTIPVNPEAAGHRAAEFDLEAFRDPVWGLSLHSRSTGDVMYILRKQAKIPARPYFEPAVDSVAKDDSLKDSVRTALGAEGAIQVEIK